MSDHPIRVAQFLPHYPSKEGLSAYCRGLSKAFEDLKGGECPIISFRPNLEKIAGHEEILHYPWKSKNPMSLPSQLLVDLKENTHRLDGVVFHGPYHPKVAMLRRYLQKIGMPYIFVPHDPYVAELTEHHAYRKWVFWHLFEKSTISGARAIQILSPSHEAPLRSLGFKVPVVEIANGCELETLNELPENPKIPGTGERVRIQYMGRMDRNHKGLDILIEAFGELLNDGRVDGVDLVLTGHDWEDREVLENLARSRNTGDRVTFTGPRPEHSLVIHAEADLVILPSRFDGFGLTIVEAMLAARPVLVSARAGVAPHVERANGGWLFEPNVDSIKKAILKALGERSRWEAMGQDNHDYVTSSLTWHQSAEKTLAMYRKYF